MTSLSPVCLVAAADQDTTIAPGQPVIPHGMTGCSFIGRSVWWHSAVSKSEWFTMSDALNDLPGVPLPLWVQQVSSEDGMLLSAACKPASDRRTWMLLLGHDGEMSLRDGAEAVCVPAGACLLRPYPDPRLAVLPSSAPWRCLVFVFTGFDEMIEGLRERAVQLRLPTGSWAQRQLQQMVEDGGELGLAHAMRLVAGILANLLEHSIEQGHDDPDSELLRRIHEAMTAAVESDAGVAQIARDLGISERQLSRVMRQHLSISPGRHLQELRMRRACNLLRDLDLDIASIAHRLGYSGTAAFGAAFKQSCGCSPSDYRSSRSIPLWERDG